MQKNILFLITFLLLTLVATNPIHAAVSITPTKSPAPTSKPTSETLSEQITNLKDKIASRVSELKLVEKKGIVGTVTDVKDLEITLTDIKGTPRFIDVDEITKFVPGDDSKTFGISDLKKGSLVSIIGRYNKDSERLLARFVEKITMPVFLSGTVSNIDEDQFTFNLKSSDGKTTFIDVENITKTQTYTRGGSPEKSGFSKIKSGDTVYITGNPDKNDAKKIIASRILLITSENDKTTTVSPTTAGKKPTPTP